MMIDDVPSRYGRLRVVTGPVDSDKKREVNIGLDRMVHSGFASEFISGKKVLVARHPKDSRNPGEIGHHPVFVTQSVPDIYNKVHDSTGIVYIVGASHFEDASLVELVDSLVRSNRRVTVAGLNLDAKGEPHGYMAQLCALADEITLAKAVCDQSKLCKVTSANRSYEKSPGEYVPHCTFHVQNPNVRHDVANIEQGYLIIENGPMFSGKTTKATSYYLKLKEKSPESVALFKWSKDVRLGVTHDGSDLYATAPVPMHSGDSINGGILVNGAKDIRRYMIERNIKTGIVEEGQFCINYEEAKALVDEGKTMIISQLSRGYNRKEFRDGGKLMCLADEVHIHTAICTQCHETATESEFLVANETQRKSSQTVVRVGGKGDYEARCLDCWSHGAEQNLQYKFNRFNPERYRN